MRDQAHEKMKNLTLSAMFAAVIMLMILYLFHIPVGSSGGYVHFGDAFIYLAACFLPMPYACGAAAIGAGALGWPPRNTVCRTSSTAARTRKKIRKRRRRLF